MREAIEALAYAFLEETHDGWEINDGAYGEFRFDVAERTIDLDYNERIERPSTTATAGEDAAMGHPYHHALSSVRKWGGTAKDYLPLHQWFDEPSKLITADFRHRALRHPRRASSSVVRLASLAGRDRLGT